MAVLTTAQLVQMRRDVAAGEATVNWNKANINAALQALEDWFEGERTTISNSIDTATSPFVFTNPQKKKIVAYFLGQKSNREKV